MDTNVVGYRVSWTTKHNGVVVYHLRRIDRVLALARGAILRGMAAHAEPITALPFGVEWDD